MLIEFHLWIRSLRNPDLFLVTRIYSTLQYTNFVTVYGHVVSCTIIPPVTSAQEWNQKQSIPFVTMLLSSLLICLLQLFCFNAISLTHLFITMFFS
jgi:hypothetical protein